MASRGPRAARNRAFFCWFPPAWRRWPRRGQELPEPLDRNEWVLRLSGERSDLHVTGDEDATDLPAARRMADADRAERGDGIALHGRDLVEKYLTVRAELAASELDHGVAGPLS